MATPDELNKALSDIAVSAASISGPAAGASSAVPQALPHSTPIAIPTAYDWLRALKAAVQPAPTSVQTVEGRRNQHWREVAEYEEWAFPLFLYLENVDWQQIVAWHETRWRQDFTHGLRYYWREHHGRYVGRRIIRNRLYASSNIRVKLVLPIPTPAEYSRKRFDEGRKLYLEVLSGGAKQRSENTADSRRLLAEQLKSAAIHLGRYERNQWRDERKWHPGWELQKAVQPEIDRYRGILQPSELGKVVTLVEWFWQCWQAFHHAEQPAATPILPIPRAQAAPAPTLAHLHPTVQQAAGSRFESTHYADAVEKACIALEKAVRDKANQPADLGGTDLMNRVFSQKTPVLTVSAEAGEREGYMFLFRGMWQALRNHHAHNDTDLPAPRALEWLSFISALFHKLEESKPTVV